MSIFIIAEAGVNHDGSLSKALSLVDIAARSGADAVKFQTFQTDRIVRKGTSKVAYQQSRDGDGTQDDMIRRLELDHKAHRAIAEHCAVRGIEFMSTPFDTESVDLLISLGMKRIKIPSGEITNKPLIRHMARQNLPLIMSTGMSSLDEVTRAVGWIRDVWVGGDCLIEADLTILHCTSNYPAQAEDINLRAMATIADATGAPIGYSDHSLGTAISIAAAAVGATVIEKHFTIDPNDPGPDHAASLPPSELNDLVNAVRMVEASLGDGSKAPRPSELPVRQLVRRGAVAARDLPKGQELGEDDMIFLRPADGIGPEDVDEAIGKRLTETVPQGTPIERRHLAW